MDRGLYKPKRFVTVHSYVTCNFDCQNFRFWLWCWWGQNINEQWKFLSFFLPLKWKKEKMLIFIRDHALLRFHFLQQPCVVTGLSETSYKSFLLRIYEFQLRYRTTKQTNLKELYYRIIGGMSRKYSFFWIKNIIFSQ